MNSDWLGPLLAPIQWETPANSGSTPGVILFVIGEDSIF